MSIAPLDPALIGPALRPEARPELAPERPPEAGAPSFATLLGQAIQAEAGAHQAADGYAIGEHQNLHETMIALEKADISLSLLVNVRNKLLEAYREVMRMS